MKNGILFFSDSRESLPIAWKLSREGVWVDYYIHCPTYKDNFDGMLPKIKLGDIPAALKRCDTVIFDINITNSKKPHDLALLNKFNISPRSPDVFGPISDQLRKTHRVIGGGQEMFQIEMDREKGFDLAKKVGFDIPPYQVFQSLSEGAKFLDANLDKLWYFKPFNNQGLDKTYGDTFPGELADMLRTTLAKDFKKDNVKFLLQENIGKGVEVSNELWITKGQFKNPNRTLEAKKLMSGNLGVATGSQSNLVWQSTLDTPIFDLMNKKVLTDYIGKDFNGPIDANIIVTEEGRLWFLEWTPRMGYSAIYLYLSFIPEGQLSNFFLNDFDAVFKDGFVASQLVSIWPYPHEDKKALECQAKDNLIDHKPWQVKDMWWQDVKIAEDGKTRCCGSDGMIGVMCNHAPVIDESIDGLYSKIKKLNISGNLQYRTQDDMMELKKRYRKLKSWGIF